MKTVLLIEFPLPKPHRGHSEGSDWTIHQVRPRATCCAGGRTSALDKSATHDRGRDEAATRPSMWSFIFGDDDERAAHSQPPTHATNRRSDPPTASSNGSAAPLAPTAAALSVGGLVKFSLKGNAGATAIVPGDIAVVTRVPTTADPATRVKLGWHQDEIQVVDSAMFIDTKLAVGKLVRSTINASPSPSAPLGLTKGAIGVIVGGCAQGAPRDRFVVDFGVGAGKFNLTEAMIRNDVGHRVGDVVYSKIEHDTFRVGDKGVIKGASADPRERDRVTVAFGQRSSTLYSLTEDMFTSQPPTRPAATASTPRSAFDLDQLSETLPSLRTDDITLISHTHGRERRAERKIMRKELQAAIKYGIKERANPGRDGSTRWRYTHDGIVYITDETSRHEVTSWRTDGKDKAEAVAPAEVELAGKGCHAVLVVDSSGSMRSSDVAGYETRSRAVYDCLVRDFVKAQVQSGAAEDVVVSLISMSNQATVLLHCEPLNETLIPKLESIGKRQPKSHGNYIPAMDLALKVMTDDAPNRASVLLLFFSDGAPSDSSTMLCEHNVPVFEIDRKQDPNMQHRTAGSAWRCRSLLHDKVKQECLDRVKKIGDVFGRDKVIFRTLAFGPKNEDFRLLDEMANALPRGEFQKLGLDASKLRTAFSSLSSSMTELRTEGGGRLLTPRRDKVVDKKQYVDQSKVVLRGTDQWWIYSFEDVWKYKLGPSGITSQRFTDDATGIAFIGQPFAEGAERFVFRCTEIAIPTAVRREWYDAGVKTSQKDLIKAERRGLRLVCKEANKQENLEKGRGFHETFMRVQADAATLAKAFNQKLPVGSPASWEVSFIETSMYCVTDWNYTNGECWVLVEPELDGRFTKWNNNAGGVIGTVNAAVNDLGSGGFTSNLGIGGALIEEEEEDDDNDDAPCRPIQVDDVPQAFSHFTYEHSRGKQLVCDIQGVWNEDDGFVLTDPVVHYVSSTGRKHKNGATDKGFEGVKRFFKTHVCAGRSARK